jgi:hypothetical protein
MGWPTPRKVHGTHIRTNLKICGDFENRKSPPGTVVRLARCEARPRRRGARDAAVRRPDHSKAKCNPDMSTTKETVKLQ